MRKIGLVDGTYAHVSNYQYKQISVGKDVYVVYCDDVAIGVFPTSRYKLG